MIEFTPLIYPKAAVEAAPENQRLLFLGCTQVANEMNILFRHARAALNMLESEHVPAREMANATVLLTLRQIISRALEFRNFTNSLGSASEDLLQAGTNAWSEAKTEFKAARAARRELARLLGEGDNALAALVRNKVGFHLNRDYLNRAFARVPEDFKFVDFHAEARMNIIYGIGETMQMFALTEATATNDPAEALGTVFDLAAALVSAVGDYAQGHAVAFVFTYLGTESVSAERPTVPDPGPLVDPLFFRPKPASE